MALQKVVQKAFRKADPKVGRWAENLANMMAAKKGGVLADW
jgi:hypothetical protein